MRGVKGLDAPFCAIVASALGYWLYFLVDASFRVDGELYFSLFDDAMISMRYAHNLADGHGLRWNVGEAPVEGYSNFLWTVYMAAWHLLPLPASKLSLPVQLTGMLCLLANLFLVREIAREVADSDRWVQFLSVLLTAGYLPSSFWALRGMETSVVSTLVLCAALMIARGIKRERISVSIHFVLGTAVLIRMEMVLLYGLFWLTAMGWDEKQRVLHLRVGFMTLAGILIAMFGSRLLYYGEWLPNTYYLKLTGSPIEVRLMRGLEMARRFVVHFNVLIFTIPLLFAMSKSSGRLYRFMLVCFLVQLTYSVRVGGDAWEFWNHYANRYLVVVMPLLLIVLAGAIVAGARRLSGAGPLSLWARRAGLAMAGPILLFLIHGGRLDGGFRGQWSSDFRQLRSLYLDEDAIHVRKGLAIARLTEPEARIAVVWAGAIPYFSKRYTIDLFGKSDPIIARLERPVTSYRALTPGHDKFDYVYSIGELQPDLVTDVVGRDFVERAGEASSPLRGYQLTRFPSGHVSWLRTRSTQIKWSLLSR